MQATSKNTLEFVNPFLYSQESPWKYRLIGFFGFISTIFVGIGFVLFLSLSIWYWLIFGPIVILLLFNDGLRHFLRILYPEFSKVKHLKFINEFWGKNNEPAVAIFLPWCGESLFIFEKTIIGVNNLRYQNKTVYILDDKGDLDVKDLAGKYGFKYLSRPNKGEYRKSGNLQYGWDNSNGEEFAFILDADFIPIQDALWHVMPYIISDPKIGILQTPQYFEQTEEKHDQSPIEYGGGNIVEEFYNIDQTSSDRFGAAICVGTSAVYRRAAILSVGGTPKVWGTEDVRTGLSITRGGYRVKYVPIIVSIGTVPETLQDSFRQHNRWCSGSLKILVKYYWQAKLSWIARLIYLMNPLYYLYEALIPILIFNCTALFAFHGDQLLIYNSLWFIPKILYDILFLPVVVRNHKAKMGSNLAAMNNIFTYFYTIFFDMPKKTRLLWHPAGVGISGISKEFRMAMRIGIGIASIYVASLTAVLIWRREYLMNIQVWMLLTWALYAAAWLTIYIYHATKFLKTHDLKYEHPTSKVRTHARRIWAHVKHIIVPALAIIMLLSIAISVWQLYFVEKQHFIVNPIANK